MTTAGPIRPTHHHTAGHAHRASVSNTGDDGFASMVEKHSGVTAAGRSAAASPAQAAAGTWAHSHSGGPACHPAAGFGKFLGHSTGSGQCVALVRAAHPDLGPTSHWVRGEAVKGNTSLQPGTPIATFSHSGRYANATDGSSHAAIYLGQTAHGVQVLDQWVGRAAAVRTIPWSHPGAAAANVGAAFHVVKAAGTLTA